MIFFKKKLLVSCQNVTDVFFFEGIRRQCDELRTVCLICKRHARSLPALDMYSLLLLVVDFIAVVEVERGSRTVGGAREQPLY